ncbi:gustatory and pheromone receptor 39a-like [Diachasma alloeum]|uniref:Gustatory receptor n=1 Tax=Diachasma alloeum TaxID=454923 RepID=A0A4E0RQR8_9HYME|nr:gustatory and pheromone receptor 39a-like [Diachasma alloeum]THK33154.1 gustatory receptor 15 [Diachasma alloeum]
MPETQPQSLGTEPPIVDTYLVKHSNSIRFLIIIYKFLGLAPISITNLTSPHRKRRLHFHNLMFKKCLLGLIYMYTLIIIVSGAAVVTVPLLNKGPQSDADLLNSATTIKGVFGITVMFVIWLIVAAQFQMALKILNRIVEMDKEMLVLQDVRADASKRQIVILFMGNCTVWISIFVLEISVVDDWYKVWTPLLLPSMIMNWYIMQYIFMLVMIESRVGSVNRGFLMIAKRRLATFAYSTARPAAMSERKMVNHFMILRRGHAILAGICRDLSAYYSFPILPTIAFLCCATIYDSYYLIVPLVVPSYYTSILEIANMICWLVMEMLPVVVLAVYVTRVLNEMEKTGSIVYNVLSQSALTYVAKNELAEFSVELLHRKVRFTAYGIFSLDGTLIRSIFGMLATYLIILMQFQINHRPDNDAKQATTSPNSSTC